MRDAERARADQRRLRARWAHVLRIGQTGTIVGPLRDQMGLPMLLPAGSTVTVPARRLLSAGGALHVGQAAELCGTCPALAGGRCLHQKLDPMPASEHGIGHVVTRAHRDRCVGLLCRGNRQRHSKRHPPRYTIQPARRRLIAQLLAQLDQHGTVVVPPMISGFASASSQLTTLTGYMAMIAVRADDVQDG